MNALSGTPFGAGVAGGAATFTFAQANLLTEVISITPTNATFVEGFQAGNTITIESGNITGIDSNVVFTLSSGDLDNSSAAVSAAIAVNGGSNQDTNNNLVIEPTSIVLVTQGATTFTNLNDIEIAAGVIGTPTTAIDIDFTRCRFSR